MRYVNCGLGMSRFDATFCRKNSLQCPQISKIYRLGLKKAPILFSFIALSFGIKAAKVALSFGWTPI